MTTLTLSRRAPLALGLAAGIAGGIAEIVWIAAYQGAVGGSAADVAAAITQTVIPVYGGIGAAPAIGLAIHMALAAGLGILLAVAVRSLLPRLAGTWTETALLVAALAGVWTVNFMILLPVLNPAFVHIVPIAVSLTSKILFGVAAAMVFRAMSRPADG